MIRFNLVLFLVLLCSSALAKKYDVSVWWRLNGENLREDDLNTRGDNASMFVSPRIKRNISDWGEVRLNPGFKFATGSGQGLIHDKKPRNSLYLNEALIKNNGKYFELNVGAINQRHVYARTVVSHLTAFPGVMGETFFYKENKTIFSNRTQVVIPAAYTFSSESEATESTPRFYSTTLEYNYKPSRLNFLKLNAGYFQYQMLPQIVAVRSATHGNTVDLTSSTTGKFRYSFKGYNLGSSLSYNYFGNWSLNSSVEFAKNTSAPSGYNHGLRSWTGIRYDEDAKSAYALKFFYFRQEADVGPGEFSHGTAYNNRVGYGGRLYYYIKDENMKFVFGYQQSDPIFISSIMAHRKVIYLRLEGLDELF